MKRRVLVVDDDRLVADTLTLDTSYSAADGLERARSFGPELLLCDVTMPDETGLQLAEAIHREMPKCQVLMLSAYSSNAEKVERQAMKMKRPLKLLNKPCRPEDLLREATRILQSA